MKNATLNSFSGRQSDSSYPSLLTAHVTTWTTVSLRTSPLSFLEQLPAWIDTLFRNVFFFLFFPVSKARYYYSTKGVLEMVFALVLRRQKY